MHETFKIVNINKGIRALFELVIGIWLLIKRVNLKKYKHENITVFTTLCSTVH